MHSHRELCDLAVRWLQRPFQANGHSCAVALSECRTGWNGEQPDALGFRFVGGHAGALDGTVLVEVKTSHNDFLADARKPHRHAGGCGNWRYFLAPEGLIEVCQLPVQWGLLEVNRRGHIKHVAGPFAELHQGGIGSMNADFQRTFLRWKMKSDTAREMYVLTHALNCVGDAEKLKNTLKEVTRTRDRLIKRVRDLEEEHRIVLAQLYVYKCRYPEFNVCDNTSE